MVDVGESAHGGFGGGLVEVGNVPDDLVVMGRRGKDVVGLGYLGAGEDLIEAGVGVVVKIEVNAANGGNAVLSAGLCRWKEGIHADPDIGALGVVGAKETLKGLGGGSLGGDEAALDGPEGRAFAIDGDAAFLEIDGDAVGGRKDLGDVIGGGH